MPKFFVHRTFAVYATEVVEVEASDEESAVDEACNSGGDYIGIAIGDSVSFLSDSTHEAFSAADHNLPVGFIRHVSTDRNGQDYGRITAA